MIALGISFHRFHNEGSCVFRRQERGIFRHSMQFGRVAREFPDVSHQQIAREIGFLQNDTSFDPRENLGISSLMVFRRVRKGNQDCRQGKGSQFREAGRS